jgi:hypothetical protein
MSLKNGKRGRPKGRKNGQGRGLAPIKRWSPKHDMIVHLHVGLKSNKEIADLVGMSEVRVGQVLRDPSATKIIGRVQEEIRDKMTDSVEEELLAISIKAVKNIRETIELEGLVHGSEFKKHQDRLSYDVLKGVGFLPGDRDGKVAERPPLNEILAERLVSALEKSNAVAEIHTAKEAAKEVEVKETRRKAIAAATEADFVLVK